MSLIWLIESGVYGQECAPLVEEIRRQSMTAIILPHRKLMKKPLPTIGSHTLSKDDCVLGYGTFPFARHIQLHFPWIPGAWCHAQNLDCAHYYAYFGRFLLNQHYAILPGTEAIRQRDWLVSVFAVNDQVFVRPTGCHKLFTGRCMERSGFAEQLAPTRYDPETLVVVSAPKTIGREWRFVIAGNEVVAVSRYAIHGNISLAQGCPQEVQQFVEHMLTEVSWRPDPIFMMDVGEADGDLRLIELSGFSNSWLYRCDLQEVVARAGEVAMHAWEREFATVP